MPQVQGKDLCSIPYRRGGERSAVRDRISLLWGERGDFAVLPDDKCIAGAECH